MQRFQDNIHIRMAFLAFTATCLPLGSVHCYLKSDSTAKYVWNRLLSGLQCPWTGSYFRFDARCILVSYRRHNLSPHLVSFSQCCVDSSFHWPEKNLSDGKNQSRIMSIPSKKWSDTFYSLKHSLVFAIAFDKSKICLASQMWPQAIAIILYSNMQHFLEGTQH